MPNRLLLSPPLISQIQLLLPLTSAHSISGVAFARASWQSQGRAVGGQSDPEDMLEARLAFRCDTTVEQVPAGFGDVPQLGLAYPKPGGTISLQPLSQVARLMAPIHPCKGQDLEWCLLRAPQPKLPHLVRVDHCQGLGWGSLRTAGPR